MKLCYVDETGTDGRSPVMVMVGVIADVARVHRTRLEFEKLFRDLAELPDRAIAEIKGSDLYYGNGRWRGVDGKVRHAAIRSLCQWLVERKHSLALAALDVSRYPDSDLAARTELDLWTAGAVHIALQVQKAHQGMKRNKGVTFLVFDEQKVRGGALANLLFDPPVWSDDYYGRSRRQAQLDQIADTAFFAQSHHIGLVQIADMFAFVFRRYSEIRDYDHPEGFPGEIDQLTDWIDLLGSRLLQQSHRWPQKAQSELGKAFGSLAPAALLDLG